jgi:hypothetical protein
MDNDWERAKNHFEVEVEVNSTIDRRNLHLSDRTMLASYCSYQCLLATESHLQGGMEQGIQ